MKPVIFLQINLSDSQNELLSFFTKKVVAHDVVQGPKKTLASFNSTSSTSLNPVISVCWAHINRTGEFKCACEKEN